MFDAQVCCSGRVVVDVMRVLHTNDLLRLYSLTDISMHVLGNTFETLSAEQVQSLLRSNNRLGWNRAMQSILAPADLALDVLSRKDVLIEVVEVSRVVGLPLQNVYIRGQMARVLSLLLMHTTKESIVIPSTSKELDKSTLRNAAMVIDPLHQSASNPNGIGTVGMHR